MQFFRLDNRMKFLKKKLKLEKNKISLSSGGIKNYFRCLYVFIQIPFVKFLYNQVWFKKKEINSLLKD